MEILKLTHVIDEEPEFGCPAYLVFKYRGMYFMAWKNLETGEIACWISDPNSICMVSLIGSIETRFPDALRLANGSDYEKYKDIVQYAQEKAYENDAAIAKFVKKNHVEHDAPPELDLDY